MSKTVLHNLIDMLNEADTETIYNVLIRFVPETKPYEDEIKAIEESKIEIANGDVMNISDIVW